MEFIKKLFAKKEAILEFLEKADEEPVEEEKEEEVVEEEIEPDEEEVEEPIEEEVEEFETDDEEDEKFFNSKSKKSRDSKQLSSVGTPLKKRESKDVDNSSLLNSFNSRFR